MSGLIARGVLGAVIAVSAIACAVAALAQWWREAIMCGAFLSLLNTWWNRK